MLLIGHCQKIALLSREG